MVNALRPYSGTGPACERRGVRYKYTDPENAPVLIAYD